MSKLAVVAQRDLSTHNHPNHCKAQIKSHARCIVSSSIGTQTISPTSTGGKEASLSIPQAQTVLASLQFLLHKHRQLRHLKVFFYSTSTDSSNIQHTFPTSSCSHGLQLYWKIHVNPNFPVEKQTCSYLISTCSHSCRFLEANMCQHAEKTYIASISSKSSYKIMPPLQFYPNFQTALLQKANIPKSGHMSTVLTIFDELL